MPKGVKCKEAQRRLAAPQGRMDVDVWQQIPNGAAAVIHDGAYGRAAPPSKAPNMVLVSRRWFVGAKKTRQVEGTSRWGSEAGEGVAGGLTSTMS